MDRRSFIKSFGGASLLLMLPAEWGWAEDAGRGENLVSVDKGLSEAWLKALTARGEPEIYRGQELNFIGMPVGGICAGLVYLGGDGKLWLWDIFNRDTMEKRVSYEGKVLDNRNGALYVEPLQPRSPLAQAFALTYRVGPVSGVRTLDQEGAWDTTFQGTYPLATVNYRDLTVPLAVKLEAFSPFIPLNVDDSSLPATIMRYTVSNMASVPAEIEFGGWIENIVLAQSSTRDEARRSNEARRDGLFLTAQIHDETSPAHPNDLPIRERHDFGTMALILIEPPAGTKYQANLPAGKPQEQVFAADAAPGENGDRPVGGVRTAFTLAPGESRTLSFVVAWHFPNVDPAINGKGVVHHYATRFDDAAAVAGYIAANFNRLCADTMTWCNTWNDSTLPHWFLNRTFSNTCNLATTTSYRFGNGQFWAWEGIYACPGTCTHVWLYAQAMARIFPELERTLREKTDFAFAFNPKTGVIQFRGKSNGFAADGQAGIILRTYREHLMSADDSFLKPLWPKVRVAMDRLIGQANEQGLLDGPQHNTLDTAWFGEISWISGLYLAALRAAQEMAGAMGDDEYAQRCRQLFERGSASLVPELFNGDYFADKVDPNHLDAINSGSGCEIDQVMGQSWAWQVGLGRIFPRKETLTALNSLWKFNFSPDAGHYHQLMKLGRWYALPGEAGLLMCTFPRPDWGFKQAAGKGPEFAIGYFNECMTGFEHQAASHMIAEGLVQEGLAVTRAIHDRYAAAKRNPFNEIECGDHYSRAMASYGSFISMCGFEHRGPDGHIGFAPHLTPEDFRCAFTSAQGWGTFWQKRGSQKMESGIAVRWGTLRLKTMSLEAAEGSAFSAASGSVGEKPIHADLRMEGTRALVSFPQEIQLSAGDELRLTLN